MREIKFRALDRKTNKIISEAEMQINDLILIPTSCGWSIAKSNPIKGHNPFDDYVFSWSDADIIERLCSTTAHGNYCFLFI